MAVYAENTALFEKEIQYSIHLKSKHKGDIWLAEIEGVNDKDQADALKGTALYCTRADLPEPADDEFYFYDLIGRACVDKDNNPIGKVIAVENFGASDLLEIQPDGASSFYLSYSDDTVLDIQDNQITVSIPEMI